MTAIVFDSLSMMKRLRGTGLTEEQSVVIIDVTRDSLMSFPTKDDVEQAVQRGIQGIDPKFASIDQRFTKIDQHFTEIDQRFSEVDNRFDEIDKRFSEVDKRFNEVDKRFNEIDRHLGQIDQRFIILEQRMTIKLGTIVIVALGAFTALSKWIA